jgi:hypothetical protein
MAIKVYDQSPYYDDYLTKADANQDGGKGLSPSEKNYTRILFRPGHSVQARELTQMQTAIQAQIDRFGRHIFKDGSRVVGGLTTFDTQYAYVKVESIFEYPSGTQLNADNYYEEAENAVLTGLGSGITASVLQVVPATTDDPLTLYVAYKKTGTDNVTQRFDPEEILQTDGSPTRYFKVLSASEVPTGYGANFNIAEGVYFVKGNFVYNPSQSLLISKYTNRPTLRMVYKVSENIVTSAEDSTLLDNALGAPNESAPGAHRYQIDLELATQEYDIDNRDEDNIVNLGVIYQGVVEEVVTESTYAEILKTMATRTHEESGNYTVRPFELTLEENETDDTKFNIQLDPSVAYVNGYRIATKAPKTVVGDRARDTEFFNGAAFSAKLGNFTYVTDVQGVPDIISYGIVDLKDSSNNDIGTARIRAIDYVSGTPGRPGTHDAVHKVYLFDVQMDPGHTRDEIAKLYDGNLSPVFTANLQTQGEILDTGNNSAIIKLPFNVVKSLRSVGGQVDMFYNVRYSQVKAVSNNKLTFTTGDSDVQFLSTNPKDWVVTVTELPTPYSGTLQVGDMIPLNTGQIVIGSDLNNPSAELTNFTSADNGVKCRATVPVRKNVSEKTKTFEEDEVINIATPTGNDSLEKADVIRIKSIIQDSDGSNITDRYQLDNGQRENFYDVASIKLIPGRQAPIGSITVTFDYFSHSSGDYFAVDSYQTVDYEDIPLFDSTRAGNVRLADVLDFRPRKDDTGSEFQNSSLGSFFNPGSIITTDIEYYLPRIDKLYVDYRGQFGIIKGISAFEPQQPKDPDDAMVLYKLKVPAYTFSPSDVKAKMVENRRYTMRDIGKLEKRIGTLEYYTSLSLLEKSAKDTQIFDGTGNQRFKNGFIVDGFYGHNVGDVRSADYRIAMDKSQGILRPHFHQDSVRLVNNTAMSGSSVTQSSSIVTLPFTEVLYDKQPYASTTENLNPYFKFKWKGMMTLSPTTDEWKDVEERPELVVDLGSGVYDAIEFLANELDVVGTEWNSWQTDWTGREVIDVDPFTFNNGNTAGTGERITTLVTRDQSRDGIRTDLFPDSMTADLGTRVVNVNFAPFIRSRKIHFRADRMKPNTRVYMFFDGKDITNYTRVTGETFVRYADTEEVKRYKDFTEHPDGAESAIYTDSNGQIEGSFIIPNNEALKFKCGTRVVRLTDNADNNLSEEETAADTVYEARGLIQTTEGTAISTTVPRFEVSEVDEERTVTETVVTSRIIRQWTIDNGGGGGDPLAQSFFVANPDGIFVTSVDIYFKTKDDVDNTPVTVQLRTMENGIPTKFTLPFSEVHKFPNEPDFNVSDDASVPTTFNFEAPVYLKDGEEYAIVLIAANTAYEAFVSEMGEFDLTNNNLRITDQPHLGSLFKSQTSTTWTPEQFKDLKFTLRRASFDSSGTLYMHNAVLPEYQLKANPFLVYNGSNKVRVVHRNHGMFEGSKVTITVPVTTTGDFNNIPVSEFNDTFTIEDVEMDSYVITVTTNADETGRLGGQGILATENALINVMQPNIQQIVLPRTKATYQAKLTSGQSLAAQNENPYEIQDWVDVIANENTYFNKLHAVTSADNQTLQDNINVRSLQLKVELETENESVSPVIDLDRASVITINNRIDNPIGGATVSAGYNNIKDDPEANSRFIDETEATGNTGLSRYITKQVTLADPADDLKLYLLVSKPSVAYVDVYYKIQLVGDDTPFNELSWTLVNPDEDIDPSNNPAVYDEVEYTLDDVGPYEGFAIKIVLRSENSSAVPLIKDLRAIALSN